MDPVLWRRTNIRTIFEEFPFQFPGRAQTVEREGEDRKYVLQEKGSSSSKRNCVMDGAWKKGIYLPLGQRYKKLGSSTYGLANQMPESD